MGGIHHECADENSEQSKLTNTCANTHTHTHTHTNTRAQKQIYTALSRRRLNEVCRPGRTWLRRVPCCRTLLPHPTIGLCYAFCCRTLGPICCSWGRGLRSAGVVFGGARRPSVRPSVCLSVPLAARRPGGTPVARPCASRRCACTPAPRSLPIARGPRLLSGRPSVRSSCCRRCVPTLPFGRRRGWSTRPSAHLRCTPGWLQNAAPSGRTLLPHLAGAPSAVSGA